MSCSFYVLSFGKSQGNGTAALEIRAHYTSELLPNFLIPKLIGTIKCGKNDILSNENNGWKGE
jgi:hypothetical protein